ncbi:MAG: metallophosphoesterase [Verrucomicrobiales bacterium]|jgi:metallophosphoesterase superfamily enzyme|nr:metallophosphoesterase [Verrucomicrobiales bacterium]
MIDPAEKSTEVSCGAQAEVVPGIFLDSRLAIFHGEEKWLALSDLHFGYELSRRAEGGLWPLWGMDSIRERLADLIDTWKPESLILVGDIVDSRAAPTEAIEWLGQIRELCPELVLIAGNHDRGEVKRHFHFVPHYETGDFFFHHGHEEPGVTGKIEITGHLHPSTRFSDGAGTSLKLPTFTREQLGEGREKWVLPAFSPWAGGHPAEPTDPAHPYHRWVCGKERVFEVA